MIRYRGREVPCFDRDGCDRKAAVRVETTHLCLHFCDEHGRAFASKFNDATVTELAPLGQDDVIPGTSLDNEDLRRSPWVREVTDTP